MPRLTGNQRETFEALRQAYLAEVPARIAAIREVALRLGRRGATRGDLEELRTLVHRLVGSSAIFGLQELSASARALEDLTTQLLEGSDRSASELDSLAAALEATWAAGTAFPRSE